MKRAGTAEALVVDLRLGRVARRRKAVINALFLQNNATGARRRWRAPRRTSGDEEGNRLEAVDHEVEGSDGLSDGAAEVRRCTVLADAGCSVQGAGCTVLGAWCMVLASRPGAAVAGYGAGPHQQREDRDAVGGAGARARGAGGGGARRRHLDRLPHADGRRAAADVLLRHDLRRRRSRAAASAASRAAAACR